MHHYFLHIAYNGSAYRGWQRQPREIKSVQAKLEDTLEKIIKEKITVYGCGRTDAAVHASQYFATIKITKPLSDNFIFILNRNLPYDISCIEIIEAQEHWHARYDATWRTYNYFIHTVSNPFINTISTITDNLDYNLIAMKKAMQLFTSYDNFGGLCLSPEKHNHTLCNVRNADIYLHENNSNMRFEFTANRFLKTMIRILVSKLLTIGKNELSLDTLEHCLQVGQPTIPLKPAPPQGLHLTKIEYPYLSRPNMSDIFHCNNEALWQKLS